MNRITGEIISPEEYASLLAAQPERAKTEFMPITPDSFQKESGKVQRNDICPCGSGRKFKHCCLITKERE
jgi:uncharacterized protein YecA (UPF0149 family)